MEEETDAEAAPAVEAETKGIFKEVKIVYMYLNRLFLVNCYLLHVPTLPSQPASTGGRLSDWLNWLDST